MGAERDERRSIKTGIDKDDCRKNRVQQKVELRKAKRDEGLQKRRNMQEVMIVPNAPADVDVSDPEAVASAGAEATTSSNLANASFETLTQTVLGFVARNGPAEEYADVLVAVRQLRKQLSMARNPPIDDCINANLVPSFVTMLGHPESKLQFEAAWCLTNIASGTAKQCEAVINANGVPPLVGLMGSPSLDVCEQAVWAIGNIAGDCAELRDLVLQNGALERVIAMVEATASMGQMAPLRNAVWALSNLMRGKPQPAMHSVANAVPTLAKLLSIQDDEVLMDTCWALSYVTDGGDDRIDLAAVTHGCVVPLMAILQNRTDSKTRTPALRTLCNILTGSAAATQAVIDAGILGVLPDSIKSTKAQTRKEACWAISNIAAGTNEQVQSVVNSPLLATVIERLANDEYEVKKEAAWVVANILHGYAAEPNAFNAARATTLVQLGAIPPMVKMLEVNDAAMQKLMLEAVGTLLEAGESLQKAKGGDNPFLVAFDEAEGVDKLESLQTHHNEEVYAKAVELLEKFFGEEGDDDENLLPSAANGGFTFGSGAQPQAAFAF